uniref:Uncharacterized protein n=1 Tax=Isometrus maculatus TaxID=497827 RepID=A0A0U1TZ28_ISOMC|nr:hypothetical protein [Isometrus maculatus]
MKIYCVFLLLFIITLQENALNVKAQAPCAGDGVSCNIRSCCSGLKCECAPSISLSCYCE